MLGPVIQGERILLEPVRPEFLPEYIRWFSDPRVTRYLASVFPMTIKQEEEWFEITARDPNRVHWAIVVDGKPVGNTSLQFINWVHRSAQSGTAIGVPTEWGKGYASEAVKLRTRFAFEELNLERLEAESFAPNKGMHKALMRSGYRQIATRTHARYGQDEWLTRFCLSSSDPTGRPTDEIWS